MKKLFDGHGHAFAGDPPPRSGPTVSKSLSRGALNKTR